MQQYTSLVTSHTHDQNYFTNGPLTRYAKLRVAHAPGMPGTFSRDADFKIKRGLAIPACITARASRTCRDACRNCLPTVAGKTFPAFPAHAHPQFYVFGKRPMPWAMWKSLGHGSQRSSNVWIWLIIQLTPAILYKLDDCSEQVEGLRQQQFPGKVRRRFTKTSTSNMSFIFSMIACSIRICFREKLFKYFQQ